LADRQAQVLVRTERSLEVEHAIPDRHTDPRLRIGCGREHAERQVLDREIGVIGGLDKAPPCRVVRFVQLL